MTIAVDDKKLTAKDYASDQDVRWCPGCGNYSILAQVKKIMANLGGKLRAANRPEGGAVFSVCLPWQPPAPDASEAEDA